MTRRSEDERFLAITEEISKDATCDRLNVGSVIVSNKSIISMGFNGAPSKLDHCDDVGHMIENNHCVRVVHSEANALLSAARNGNKVQGATLYCNYQPCWECFKLIINAGISKVVYKEIYKKEDSRVVEAAFKTGIVLFQVKTEKDE